ncbi:MAG: hypothetical protein M3P48_05690 [Actinomycetota bacterium]|nr:hypothetical protein [Actinomycetota bacterium]
MTSPGPGAPARTACPAEVYEAVIESDVVAALDHPALAAAMAWRTPRIAAAIAAYTDSGGPSGMPILVTVVSVALALL